MAWAGTAGSARPVCSTLKQAAHPTSWKRLQRIPLAYTLHSAGHARQRCIQVTLCCLSKEPDKAASPEPSAPSLPVALQRSPQLQPAGHQGWPTPLRHAYKSLLDWAGIAPNTQHDTAILALAVPSMLALAADPLLSLVDTACVGRLGPDELAALGVNTALFSFAFITFNFLATATTPLIAAAVAAGDRQQAGRVTLQALGMALLLGTGASAALLLGADEALTLMGASPDTGRLFALSKDYLLYRAVAAPAALVMTVGQGAFRGLQDMRTPLYITVGANLVNLSLDIILIFGWGLGVKGAGIATSAAEYISAAAYLSLLWRRRDDIGVWPLPEMNLRQAGSDFIPFLQAGSAVLMRTTLLLGTKTMASAVATRLGTVPIAAHQILMQLWVFSSLIIDSLAISGQTLIAISLGRGHGREAREVADRLLELGMGLGLGLAAVYAVSAPVLPRIFTNDADVAATVLELLPLAVAMLPINSLVFVLDGVLVGASDFRFLAGAMVFAAAGAVALLLAVEPLERGLEGVWAALAVLMVGRLTALAWRYQSLGGPLPPAPRMRRLPQPGVIVMDSRLSSRQSNGNGHHRSSFEEAAGSVNGSWEGCNERTGAVLRAPELVNNIVPQRWDGKTAQVYESDNVGQKEWVCEQRQ